ncbi:pali-domain-containing protein [Coprinopsis marcescibilis]|uniref:Pali-domain-containing protein n=1 Tax=Coprinopsis marcescibilis TaxID=230819 RepID=A0A5C3KY63_COPMA|nr:pali-domain-containing protein [Coprinopsis marcescibilis]
MVQIAGAALPGVFFCFAAMVLLIFVSVSEPTWDRVSFLNVRLPNGTTHYGAFGYTNHDVGIGYFFPNDRLNSNILHNLTKTLILHPIAAGLSGLAFFFGICGVGFNRVGTIFMALLAGLALLTCLVAWIIDMILFGIARQRNRDEGLWAQYGNANWLTLGALVSLLLAFCTAAVGAFGRYKRKRTDAAY